ncbi:MAG: 4Fe-4S binding protein [Candidatus Methanoperedens sp.]|nr:4Fe-4S binding protein [Candidatus Methanoperedens sp.]
MPKKLAITSSLQIWRRIVQASFILLSISIGLQFNTFYNQIVSGGPVTTPRPAGVEAFLPISALLGMKRLLLTGYWDMIHPAGLTFLVAVIIGAIFFRRAFCSWICPFGSLSHFLEWAHHRLVNLPLHWNIPRWLKITALGIKYILLILILWIMVFTMPLSSIEWFLFLPYNLAADANMLIFISHISIIVMIVIAGLIVFTIIVKNGWCRFLCPYGALLSVLGLLSPLRITRNDVSCQHCMCCNLSCGVGIQVEDKHIIHSPECTMCLSCVSACPTENTLVVRTLWGTRAGNWLIPLGIVGIIFVAYAIAIWTGHWNSVLTLDDFRNAYQMGVRHK